MMSTNTEPRFYVHTVRHAVSGRKTEYWVVDRTTNLPVDETVSKAAANATAKMFNADPSLAEGE